MKYVLFQLYITRPTWEWMTASHGSGIEVTATWGSEFICEPVSIAVSVELFNAAELKGYWINSVVDFTIPLMTTRTTTNCFQHVLLSEYISFVTRVGSEFACAPSSPTVRRPTWRGRAYDTLDCRGQRFAGRCTKDLPIQTVCYLVAL